MTETSMKNSLAIRQMAPTDYDDVLRINEENVEVLSPMSLERLEWMLGMAELSMVFTEGVDGPVVGFLLAFAEGCEYDSVNYRWFCNKYDAFLYIDRIVMDAAARGRGLGRRAYEVLLDHARKIGSGRIVAEIDSRPPNEGSLAFHRAMGFEQVGTQELYGGKKEVSLQCLEVDQPFV